MWFVLIFDFHLLTNCTKSSDPVSRHCWSLQIAMKVGKMCSFQPALWPLSAEEDEGHSAG